MPTYKTRLSRAAQKEFDRLDSTLQTRILKKLKGLEVNPRELGAIKLAGDEAWRVRVGDYRIIFDIHDDILLVLVVKIGYRREVYR